MNTQTLTKSALNFSFVVALPAGTAIQATSRDYGFDYDPAELAGAAHAALSARAEAAQLSEAELAEIEQSLQPYFS